MTTTAAAVTRVAPLSHRFAFTRARHDKQKLAAIRQSTGLPIVAAATTTAAAAAAAATAAATATAAPCSAMQRHITSARERPNVQKKKQRVALEGKREKLLLVRNGAAAPFDAIASFKRQTKSESGAHDLHAMRS